MSIPSVSGAERYDLTCSMPLVIAHSALVSRREGANMVTTVLKKPTDFYTRVVVDAIQSKMGGNVLTCPVSGDAQWNLQEFQGALPATDQFHDVQALTEMSRSFPLAVLVCETCGYSMMFNLFALGVGEELGLHMA